MAFYDFIEIGTSDFETELERANGRRGLSIEPWLLISTSCLVLQIASRSLVRFPGRMEKRLCIMCQKR